MAKPSSRPPTIALSAAAPILSASATRLLILQPTPFCNVNCDYCYLPGRDRRERMTVATARQAAQRLLDDGLVGEELTVLWHAGEPLVMPPDFYDEAFAAIDAVLGARTRLAYAMQTNGTLIDERWCELFARHGLRVGVSIDGPADLHDRHRRTREGRGTHARVLAGLQRLRERGIAHHAIAVVSRESLDRADEFFDFFVAQGIRDVACNVDEAEGAHVRSSLAGHEAAHDAFLQRLLDRSIASGGRLVVREIAAAARLVARPLLQYRHDGADYPENAQVMPFALVTVAWNGDYSTFSPELLGQASADYGDFVLGNVERSGYLACVASDRFQRLWRAVRDGVDACRRDCAYFGFCGGGAPVNKLYENGDLASTETLYCRSMLQRPFDAVLGRIERDGPPAPRAAAETAP